jgi:RIMS-binding protein 2
MWMPVDPRQTPDSVPTGYKVYIDGVSAALVTGAENSSTYISQFTISTLYTVEPHRLHVKTMSKDGESCESNIVTFTSDMLAVSEQQTDELHGSKASLKEQENNEALTSQIKPTATHIESEENSKDKKDVDSIVQSVKVEMSQQQQRQAEVVNTAAAVTTRMFTIEGDDEEESETESSEAQSESEGEAVEIFATPDKSEASVSRDELSEGEVAMPVGEADHDQNGTDVKIVDVDVSPVLPSKIASIRKFTALFDYDPATMSPNDDGAEEELKFSKGNIITVYGDKDEDGFYLGEIDGRQGFVPYNMVTELVTETLNGYPETENGPTQDALSPENAAAYDLAAKDSNSSKREKMIALFDYNPHEHSPNADAEAELPLHAGDVIYVIGEVDEDGFYEGENENGQRGLVPSNYLGVENEDGYQVLSPLDGATTYSAQDFTVHKEADGNQSLASEPHKKKKGLLSKGKNLMKRLGKSGKVRQK